MEMIGYLIAYALYMVLRERSKRPVLARGTQYLGHRRAAYWARPRVQNSWRSPTRSTPTGPSGTTSSLSGGKTIVGGLAGGWIGVELVKREFGIRRKTGDLFVFPIIIGTCFGRVGCFLEGLEDHTYGIATNLPMGRRLRRRRPTPSHPTLRNRLPHPPGQSRSSSACAKPGATAICSSGSPMSYFGWRLAVDFIKPHDPRDLWLGISPIQWVCVAGDSGRAL
jgi:phosphatidylglycerol---prolipoprotein diacylglyceryl transferase